MKKLGLAVIGTSWITAAFLSAARECDAYEILAVYSRTLDKGQTFADANNIPKVYTDLDEMLKEDAIDVVYIASPNDMHYPQAKQAMLAGKDVIGEKPLVSTLREMEDLVRTIIVTGKFVVEAITLRHVPNLEIVKKALPRIGALKIIRADMSQFSSRYPALKEGKVTNVFDPHHSGGALYDIGIYPISLVVSLLGEPLNFTYTANLHENGVDLSGIFLLEYPDTKAVCSFTKDSYGPNFAVFEGDLGYLQIDGAPSRIGNVTLVTPQGKEELGVSQVENSMVYEAGVFANLFHTRDQAVYDTLTKHSLILARIMEDGRKHAGVRFVADTR
ncbi:MAG TPA: oxidoreductase [Erysipelotrichaceae bacterium]|nr:oxidoreductase [Erysipelotrichaceae bacterium]